jgi:uncharacterized protein YqeY
VIAKIIAETGATGIASMGKVMLASAQLVELQKENDFRNCKKNFSLK